MGRDGGKVRRTKRYFLILIIFFFISANDSSAVYKEPKYPPIPENLSPSVKQVILVKGFNGMNTTLTGWEKEDNAWHLIFESMPAMLGKNGVARIFDKKEGDGRTPLGIFKLRRAFGYLPSVETGLVYTQVTENDFWVDDPDSPQYNQWVKGPPNAKSFEKLRRDDDLYKYAIVIEYNTDPIIPGKGSAIFLHVWRDDKTPTAGCVAVSEENLLKLLQWLDSKKEPVIILDVHIPSLGDITL